VKRSVKKIQVENGSLLLGGTSNTAALRAIAEIEHWNKITSGTDIGQFSKTVLPRAMRAQTSTSSSGSQLDDSYQQKNA
jgi:hypothetical protein